MKVAVTGVTGFVGHWVARELLARGHEVTALGRKPAAVAGVGFLDFELGTAPDLAGQEALVHCAFAHVPGRYRGGEGEDPERFRRLNIGGTLRVFEAARAGGLGRILFLSSRAVYGGYPAGTALSEPMPPKPDTLYGEVKLEAETALAATARPGLAVASLRATGVYGVPPPGLAHKWRELFRRFAAGEELPARIGTEVHAGDLAGAVACLLEAGEAALGLPVFNVSDFALDRRDLLSAYASAAGVAGLLPPAADPGAVSAMGTARLGALGWRPRGPDALPGVLRDLVGFDRAADRSM